MPAAGLTHLIVESVDSDDDCSSLSDVADEPPTVLGNYMNMLAENVAGFHFQERKGNPTPSKVINLERMI